MVLGQMKSAVITGCSSGIGKALAKEFRSKGFEVFAGARRLEAMEDLKEVGIHTFQLDVTVQESVDEFKYEVLKMTDNRVDFLVNNAGQPCTLPGLDVEIEDVHRCFDVNFYGPIRMCKAFSESLIAAKGKIIQIASVAGVAPFPWGSVYGASKAALQQYSASLRLELAPFGVDVVSIITGGVYTNISDTRPIPEGSIFIDALESFEMRKRVARNNSPMSAEEFSARVFRAINKKKAPEQVWEGAMSGLLRFGCNWLPRSWFVYLILRRFFMFDYFAKVTARLARRA
jgi:1-acylglycerone phosphate reductase